MKEPLSMTYGVFPKWWCVMGIWW